MSTSLDGVLIKKANKTETYTDAQIEDLAKCMDHDNGYLHFARNFAFIQHPVKGKLLFDPFYQAFVKKLSDPDSILICYPGKQVRLPLPLYI